MSANRSSAVMQQRADPPDSLDYFPTPPWAARALCEFLQASAPEGGGENLSRQSCWEPAAGEWHLERGLRDYFGTIVSSDVFPFGNRGAHDFLVDRPDAFGTFDWIVTNPPFVLGEAFIGRALQHARLGVAMFVRSAFTESMGRYRTLFGPDCQRPDFVLQFVERVVLLKGRLIQSGAPDPFNLDEHDKPRKASSATSYCWLVWQKNTPGFEPVEGDTRHRWLGTPRRQLERPGDYPEYPEQWAAIAAANKGELL